MKMAPFFFTLAGFSAFTLGLGIAGEPSTQPFGQGPSRDHVANNQEATGRQGSDNTRTKHAPVTELYQPGLPKPALAGKDRLVMNKTANSRGQLAKPPPPSLPTGVYRGRGTAPASIGGPTGSSAKNSAAAINGTVMRSKP